EQNDLHIRRQAPPQRPGTLHAAESAAHDHHLSGRTSHHVCCLYKEVCQPGECAVVGVLLRKSHGCPARGVVSGWLSRSGCFRTDRLSVRAPTRGTRSSSQRWGGGIITPHCWPRG